MLKVNDRKRLESYTVGLVLVVGTLSSILLHETTACGCGHNTVLLVNSSIVHDQITEESVVPFILLLKYLCVYVRYCDKFKIISQTFVVVFNFKRMIMSHFHQSVFNFTIMSI